MNESRKHWFYRRDTSPKDDCFIDKFPEAAWIILLRLSVRRLIRKGSFVTRFSAEYINVEHGRERTDEKRRKGIGKK